MLEPRIHVPWEKIDDFRRRWGIEEFSFFGSVVRDDFGPESDVDILVTFAPGTGHGWSEWQRMEDELRAMFGREVDLVSRNAIRNPFHLHEMLNPGRALRPEDRDAAFLWEMREAARDSQRFSAGLSREEVEASMLEKCALARTVDLTCRAAARITQGFRDAHPEIPWDEIIAAEAPLTPHIDVDALWTMVRERIPRILPALELLVPPLPPSSEETRESGERDAAKHESAG